MEEKLKDHRFMDEAGDTTFYGKGMVSILGQEGVSNCFLLGMLKIRTNLNPIREKILEMQRMIEADPYFKVPSVEKKINKGGFYFHATDDLPEVRKIFYDYIKTLDCSFEAVVGRKIPEIYARKHGNKENEFYADMLSHLIKNKLSLGKKLILNIAERGKTTKNQNLEIALQKAKKRFEENVKNKDKLISTSVVFNVQNQKTEPILNIADYLCWAIQRVFEKGEMRYYNYMSEKISLVIDIYDTNRYQGNENYYTKKNQLTAKNKISPPLN
jgi:hypothetical protein